MARILLVEDDPMLQFLLKKILEQDNHQLAVASDGIEAQTLLTSFRPELALLDIMLPDISGFSLLAQFRQIYNLVQLPIIMLSAKSSHADVLQSLQSGANDYMFKPANHQELKARITIQLQIRELALHSPGPFPVPEPL